MLKIMFAVGNSDVYIILYMAFMLRPRWTRCITIGFVLSLYNTFCCLKTCGGDIFHYCCLSNECIVLLPPCMSNCVFHCSSVKTNSPSSISNETTCVFHRTDLHELCMFLLFIILKQEHKHFIIRLLSAFPGTFEVKIKILLDFLFS